MNMTQAPPVGHSRYATAADVPQLTVRQISCQKLFDREYETIAKATTLQQGITKRINDAHDLQMLMRVLDNCKLFRRMFVNKPINEEEETFPIAFSILFYQQPDQVARLLRAIYRPQNYYCLHVDASASHGVYSAAMKIARCFNNVFVASKRINVVWGWYSVVEPDVICMQDLWRYPEWKYFINLTGQEFPLMTNLEMVRVLKAYRGANDIETVPMSQLTTEMQDRVKFGYASRDTRSVHGHRWIKPKFPYNITWAKGAVHIAASRPFVDFLLHNKAGLALQSWVRDTSHASEHLFNPLQDSPQLGVPGSYTGPKSERKQSFVRYKVWDYPGAQCHGKWKRNICIISIRDLWLLGNSTQMVVNKLFKDYHPLAYSCLEQRIFEKTLGDVLGENHLNLTLYENSDFVKHHITVSQ